MYLGYDVHTAKTIAAGRKQIPVLSNLVAVCSSQFGL